KRGIGKSVVQNRAAREEIWGTLCATSLWLLRHLVHPRHPFCIQGDEYQGLSNCGFDSYAQCNRDRVGWIADQNRDVLWGDDVRGYRKVAIDLLDVGFWRGGLADAQT